MPTSERPSQPFHLGGDRSEEGFQRAWFVYFDGWFLVHTVGSHQQFKHPTKPGKVTVPHPKKDLPPGTARSILKQAGL
ncbi:hypothetical protein CLD22_12085 [Rubrivivax gelatinosus]|nr:hypothetical protein [Rubrivivax gelatinosus]